MNIRVLPALILYITAVYYIQLCSFWFIPCCCSSFISEEKNNDTVRLVHGISSLCNTRKAIRQGHPVRAAIHHLLNQPTTHPSMHPNHTHTDTATSYPLPIRCTITTTTQEALSVHYWQVQKRQLWLICLCCVCLARTYALREIYT